MNFSRCCSNPDIEEQDRLAEPLYCCTNCGAWHSTPTSDKGMTIDEIGDAIAKGVVVKWLNDTHDVIAGPNSPTLFYVRSNADIKHVTLKDLHLRNCYTIESK